MDFVSAAFMSIPKVGASMLPPIVSGTSSSPRSFRKPLSSRTLRIALSVRDRHGDRLARLPGAEGGRKTYLHDER